ncbi:MAG: hypothetical protein A2W93_03230 [Bacteroidetes bacterium GWF2_43_63]|nr:MAG: hypothetical protein A2W94_09230 [Bacteroidetes bacterium GWE2_42_42]OFY53673.1 MAG: hypothetical protein A2W93_03230 [Bacteroidetes bacterium GWF2_43_63]HBG70982.1 hypothetical protein [Bacteroidales bacterium]HCB62927.1 hypothetical protein [Bacteroidales bacterium]HCY24309.1 hypothetical protein [Bacteroidales bacterium]
MKINFRINETGEKYLFFLLFLLVWVYVIFRAAWSPITHDEAETFFIYIQPGKFIPPDAYPDANNHLLNSLLTNISYKLFGNSLLALRLPNVLLSVLYFFFVFKLSGLLKNRFNRWGFVLSMIFCHFIIEFFGYARGYGLSMAFLAGALYHLIQFYRNASLRNSALVVVFLIPALAANLTLIHTYLLIHLLLVLFIIFNFRQIKRSVIVATFAIQIFAGAPVLYILAKYSMVLRSGGALYYGGTSNFWDATLGSLSAVLFRPLPQLLSYLFVAVFAAALIIFIFLVIKKFIFKKENLFYFIFPFLLGGNVVMTFVLSRFFGVNFPEDRVAMYFIILFAGTIFFLCDTALISSKRWRILLFTPFVFIIVQFFLSLSIRFTSYTPEYRVPDEFYNYLVDESAKRDFPPVIEAYRLHSTEWYYINSGKGNKLSPITYEIFPSASAEFVIADNKEFPDWNKYYNELMFDSQSGMYLLKRKAAIVPQLLFATDTLMNQSDSMEYFNLIISDTDTLVGRNILFTIDMQVRAEAVPFQTAIIAAASGADGSTLRTQALEFERMQPDWSANDGEVIRMSMLLPQIPEGTNRILIFVFNKNKVPFRIIRSETRMYSYF